jgi:hypothetical protein
LEKTKMFTSLPACPACTRSFRGRKAWSNAKQPEKQFLLLQFIIYFYRFSFYSLQFTFTFFYFYSLLTVYLIKLSKKNIFYLSHRCLHSTAMFKSFLRSYKLKYKTLLL